MFTVFWFNKQNEFDNGLRQEKSLKKVQRSKIQKIHPGTVNWPKA
jgi:hypothetical protein